MTDTYSIAKQAADMLMPLAGGELSAGLILGSGLGGYASLLTDRQTLSYADIPGFPVSSVKGHAGRFVIGDRMGKRVIVMEGRFHAYEGYAPELLTLGVRTMFLLGVKTLVVTNAAGGVNLSYAPGDLMLISDHINLSGISPLAGPNDERFGLRFPDQSDVYTAALRERTKEAAAAAGIPLQEGVYLMMRGPVFETPAEIRMIRTLGADAVGMSTVPEAAAASHCGMSVIGISLVSNMAAGVQKTKLTHEEVQETAAKASLRFTNLIDIILKEVL